MLGIDGFSVFLATSLALNATPGPDMLYVATRGAAQGRAAGIVSALAIGTGCCFHIVAAALGLSALLMCSATAFGAVKWAGAAYLVVMGARSIMEASRPLPESKLRPEPLPDVFRKGVLVNVLNPKVALFFISFLPQFANPASNAFHLQIITLGLAFNLGGVLVNSLVALACGWAGQRLLQGRAHALQARLSGAIFISLGLGLGLSDSR